MGASRELRFAAIAALSIPFAISGEGCRSVLALHNRDVGAPVHRSSGANSRGRHDLIPVRNASTVAQKIVNRAKLEVRRGVVYDASYAHIAYPGGDVSADRGACTDVIIRSLRAAGCDLQTLIHEDMRRSFRAYPRCYGEAAPNGDIDHRRTLNQIVFLRRHGVPLPTSTTGDARLTWRPGDLVYWQLDSSHNHCGVVSDIRNPEGLPLVIHNLSRTAEEDCLASWRIIGHFRYPRPRSEPDL